MLINSLKDEGYDQKSVIAVLESLTLSPTARAETLLVPQFIELTRLISLSSSWHTADSRFLVTSTHGMCLNIARGSNAVRERDAWPFNGRRLAGMLKLV